MKKSFKNGLEVFVENTDRVRNARTGLVTHPAAVDRKFNHSIDVLMASGLRLAALFSPEHGIRSAAADGLAVGDSLDERTGLPVFSLYGKTIQPTHEMLTNIDVLLFDLQDTGVRFYTYISTLYHVLRGAAKAGKPVIVLDRPNPINGIHTEGPLIEDGFISFVGITPIPIRYGLTIGELALYMNRECGLGADLTVIEMTGWERENWFEDTGRAWVPTSPAMPHLSTAVVYPGTCLLEGTNLSEGRGTALPFEIIGAPWLDSDGLATQLNRLGLTGVLFRPTEFTPSASKHANVTCQGVQVHVVDRAAFLPVRTGLEVIAACMAQNEYLFEFLPSVKEGQPSHFDRLMGSGEARFWLKQGKSISELANLWNGNLTKYTGVSHRYWLYD